MAAFKTAYGQKAIALDVAVKATVNTGDASQTALGKAFALRQANADALTAIKVGDLVVYTAPADGKPASIVRTLSLAEATHMIAQSDNTMEYGHIPVENRDYRYFPMVNGTYPTTLEANTPVKKVNLYKLDDKSDILLDLSQGETA